MQQQLSGWDDTIVALATPHGIGAIGVIRLSGKNAIGVANELFPSKDLQIQPSHSLHVGFLKKDDQSDIDEVVLSLFRAPKSYTGEDVVEISCHGSPFVLQQVIQACLGKGARLAKAGEFTQRAFLNGKLDLTQAEAVADLIAANTSASQRSALHNIRGRFSDVLKKLREDLIRFSALIELELDFSEEDVEFADRSAFLALVDEASRTTNDLLSSFRLGNVIKNGVSVAIIGKPNAGKSTLLNTLLNEDRAIVSDIAGTTRDTIEEVINIDGILFRFIDTAGLRDNSQDLIELIGMEKSREKIAASDEVIYIFDINTETPAELEAAIALISEKNGNYLLVGNKTDLAGEAPAAEKFAGHDVLFISAKEQHHIPLLKQQLVEKVLKGKLDTENTIITNARHFEALQQVRLSLLSIRAGLEAKRSGDLLTPDIHQCLHHISTITGDISNEDVLDYIFSKFCIGK
ncbi:MAG: tRNA uridine-5-carboxymethylaminomethyl(34) synthesis GTPase MnmE [Chitinophagaceae bacterium]|nr:tRNA uridine-5-carboxymethylaminomethyl(34) synthesis GTPase MnmE [Chitinophagaceae bacterium]